MFLTRTSKSRDETLPPHTRIAVYAYNGWKPTPARWSHHFEFRNRILPLSEYRDINHFGLRAQPRTTNNTLLFCLELTKSQWISVFPLLQQILKVCCTSVSTCSAQTSVHGSQVPLTLPERHPCPTNAVLHAETLTEPSTPGQPGCTLLLHCLPSSKMDDGIHTHTQIQPSKYYSKTGDQEIFLFWMPARICHACRSLQQLSPLPGAQQYLLMIRYHNSFLPMTGWKPLLPWHNIRERCGQPSTPLLCKHLQLK